MTTAPGHIYPSYRQRVIELLLIIYLTFTFPIVSLVYCELPLLATITFIISIAYIPALWLIPESFYFVVIALVLLVLALAGFLALLIVVGLRVWKLSKTGSHSPRLNGLLFAFIISTSGASLSYALTYAFVFKEWPTASSPLLLLVHKVTTRTFTIVNRSSVPSLRKGEVVLGVPLHRPVSAPIAPGDLVMAAIPRPHSPTTMFARRVVALEGSTVQMRHGVLHIDGTPVQRERISDFENLSASDADVIGDVKQFWRETLPNGRSYITLKLDESNYFDDTEEFKVPEGAVFLLGDSRDNSIDSRDREGFGTVTREQLLYRLVGIIWSSDLTRIGPISNQ